MRRRLTACGCLSLLLLAVVARVGADGDPLADDVTVTIDAGTPASIVLAATHTFDSALQFAVVGDPSHGTLGPIGTSECTYPGGVARCTATVVYTPAIDYAGADSFTYAAHDSVATSNIATVSVTIRAPAPVMPPDAMVALGDLYAATVAGVFAGATVSWGDGSAAEALTVDGEWNAVLGHTYTDEGSFLLTVTNPTGAAATSFVHVLLAGSSDTERHTVAPGDAGTVDLTDLTVTLYRSPDGPGPATLLGAVYPSDLPGFFVAASFGAPLAAYDVRVVGAIERDSATVSFRYPDTWLTPLPILTFFDPATGTFTPVAGSTLVSPSLSIDPVARVVTVVLDSTSRPRITELTGTRLVVSDLASPRVSDVGEPVTAKKGPRIVVHTGQRASCPAMGKPCALSVRARPEVAGAVAGLRPPNLVIGHSRRRLRAGNSADVTFTLIPRARRMLQRFGQLPVVVTSSARVQGEAPRTVVRTVILQAP